MPPGYTKEATGCFAGTEKKYWSIAQSKMHPLAYYQVAKVPWCSDILIFNGWNGYKLFFKRFFYSSSITFKIKTIEKIHTKSFKILFKKSVLLAFLVILMLALKIEYFYWNWITFCITLEPTMSKMLRKIPFFGLFWNLRIFGFQQESKTRNKFDW